MAQNRTAVNRKEIIKKVKSERIKKRNITFSLSTDLLEDFSVAVQKDGISMTDIIEQMIKSYLGKD